MKYFSIVLALLLPGCTLLFGPDVGPAPELKVSSTPEQLARGKYLFSYVVGCQFCHSERDWSKFGGPVKENTIGQGGEEFSEDIGLPGKLYARNITPAGLGNWTDGEILRAMTMGVSKDNSALFPLMPYRNYANMTQSDAEAVIAFVRTLTPIERPNTPRHLNFPVNFIVNTIPARSTLPTSVNKNDSVAYGKYLVTIASCGDCHTPRTDRGQPIVEKTLAGGNEFKMKSGIVRTANITPETKTGIGNMSKEAFVDLFRQRSKPEAIVDVKDDEFNTRMPWALFGGMEQSDLEAIYDYLRTVPPIDNAVERLTAK